MRRRTGFTLVELMVVIGIVTLLMSILVYAVRGVMAGTREKATTATIRKIDAMLTKRTEGFARSIIHQDEVGGNGAPYYVNMTIYDFKRLQDMWVAGEKDRVKAESRILWYARNFPMNGAESKGQVDASYTNAETLYWLIRESAAFGVEPVDTDAFTSNEIGDIDNNGRPEFIDAWGNPIRFYRAPTRLIRPAIRAADVTKSQTILDPSGTPRYQFAVDTQYAAYLWSGLESHANRGEGTTLQQEQGDSLARDPMDGTLAMIPTDESDAEFIEDNYYTPETFHLPLIVSAGGDAALGLYEPSDRSNFGHLAQPNPDATEALFDNITNRNYR